LLLLLLQLLLLIQLQLLSLLALLALLLLLIAQLLHITLLLLLLLLLLRVFLLGASRRRGPALSQCIHQRHTALPVNAMPTVAMACHAIHRPILRHYLRPGLVLLLPISAFTVHPCTVCIS
jgi:hypothetical protein